MYGTNLIWQTSWGTNCVELLRMYIYMYLIMKCTFFTYLRLLEVYYAHMPGHVQVTVYVRIYMLILIGFVSWMYSTYICTYKTYVICVYNIVHVHCTCTLYIVHCTYIHTYIHTVHMYMYIVHTCNMCVVCKCILHVLLDLLMSVQCVFCYMYYGGRK